MTHTTDPTKLADAWAWERWPSSYDFPERDAAREAYLAALRRPTPPSDVAKLREAHRKLALFHASGGHEITWEEADAIVADALASQDDSRRETEFSKVWDEAWASQDAPSVESESDK